MGPLIYVGTYSIKPGKLEEARKRVAELVDFVETNEPRLIAFHCFFNEEGSKLTVIHLHPDSASMEFHQQVNAKHFATAFDYLETPFNDAFYGEVSDVLRTELAKWDDPGVETIMVPVHEAGFTRTTVR